MIQGEVNPFLEAVIAVTVIGRGGDRLTVEAVVDTGFSDYLTLAPTEIISLALVYAGVVRGQLADGTTTGLRAYRGRVIWDGQERGVEVLEGSETPLVGMQMLHGFGLTMRVVDGGGVQIEQLA
jgi:clan AA aspartic protease